MNHETRAQSRILLVGRDAEHQTRVARTLQEAGYGQPWLATSMEEALLCAKTSLPSLLVLDTGPTGADLGASLGDLDELTGLSTFLPILVLCDELDPERGGQAVKAGASYFVRREVGPRELLLHVSSLLCTRSRLTSVWEALEESLRARTRELERAHLDTMARLGRVARLRDDKTGEHTARVGHLSGAIAQALHLSPELARLIMHAAPLHDIGMVFIPDHIWLKASELSESEREAMQQHTTLGAGLLAGGESELMKTAEEIAAHHHERWDGQGYSLGLRATDIPLSARIVSAADAYDAMTHGRPHKGAASIEDALAIMEQERGWQFDPDVVEAFFRVVEREKMGEPHCAGIRLG
jgi:putative two-component system response regulator